MASGRKLPPGLARIDRSVIRTKKQRLGFKMGTRAIVTKAGNSNINRGNNAGAMVPLHPNRVFGTDAVVLTLKQKEQYNREFGRLMAGLTQDAKARRRLQFSKLALAKVLG